MRFWKISAPDYTSDYQQSNINGSIENALNLPSVDCNLLHDDLGLVWTPFTPIRVPGIPAQ